MTGQEAVAAGRGPGRSDAVPVAVTWVPPRWRLPREASDSRPRPLSPSLPYTTPPRPPAAMPARAPPSPAQPAGKRRRRRYRRAGGGSFPPGLAEEGHPLPRRGRRGPSRGFPRRPVAAGACQRIVFSVLPRRPTPPPHRRGRAAGAGPPCQAGELGKASEALQRSPSLRCLFLGSSRRGWSGGTGRGRAGLGAGRLCPSAAGPGGRAALCRSWLRVGWRPPWGECPAFSWGSAGPQLEERARWCGTRS